MKKFICLILLSGCTAESTKIALEVGGRVENVQDTICDNSISSLKIQLYQSMVQELNLTEEQKVIANKFWQERDTIDFWLVQWERARTLRLLGIDSKLYSEQSVFDLFYKRFQGDPNDNQ